MYLKVVILLIIFFQICDHNMVILFVDARHPGSNHESFVWEQSSLAEHIKSNFTNGKTNTWLLGTIIYKMVNIVLV